MYKNGSGQCIWAYLPRISVANFSCLHLYFSMVFPQIMGVGRWGGGRCALRKLLLVCSSKTARPHIHHVQNCTSSYPSCTENCTSSYPSCTKTARPHIHHVQKLHVLISIMYKNCTSSYPSCTKTARPHIHHVQKKLPENYTHFHKNKYRKLHKKFTRAFDTNCRKFVF